MYNFRRRTKFVCWRSHFLSKQQHKFVATLAKNAAETIQADHFQKSPKVQIDWWTAKKLRQKNDQFTQKQISEKPCHKKWRMSCHLPLLHFLLHLFLHFLHWCCHPICFIIIAFHSLFQVDSKRIGWKIPWFHFVESILVNSKMKNW